MGCVLVENAQTLYRVGVRSWTIFCCRIFEIFCWPEGCNCSCLSIHLNRVCSSLVEAKQRKGARRMFTNTLTRQTADGLSKTAFLNVRLLPSKTTVTALMATKCRSTTSCLILYTFVNCEMPWRVNFIVGWWDMRLVEMKWQTDRKESSDDVGL